MGAGVFGAGVFGAGVFGVGVFGVVLLPEPELEPEPVELLELLPGLVPFPPAPPLVPEADAPLAPGVLLPPLDAYTKGITYAVVPNTINADIATIIQIGRAHV